MSKRARKEKTRVRREAEIAKHEAEKMIKKILGNKKRPNQTAI